MWFWPKYPQSFRMNGHKNIRKNIICKTSEGATRSRTKSRGANPASRPSAKTHIQTENSTLSNRVFFCIIILLRTLVFLPFLHTILLWYFFVLLDFPNVLGFWICVFALDDDFASSLGSSIFEKCWVTLLVALWFSNVLGFLNSSVCLLWVMLLVVVVVLRFSMAFRFWKQQQLNQREQSPFPVRVNLWTLDP